MPRKRQSDEEIPNTEEATEAVEVEEAAPEPISLAGSIADKWGIPRICLESIQYAVKDHTSGTWPGLAGVVSEHEGEQQKALDTLGYTLTRITPFCDFTATLVNGGEFETWASDVSKGFSPDNEFPNRIITFYKEH